MRILSMTTIGLIAVGAAAGFVGSGPQPVRVPPRHAPTTPLRATMSIAPLDRALTFADRVKVPPPGPWQSTSTVTAW